MERVQEYQMFADQCRKMAGKMRDEERRKELLKLAETWDRMADNWEKTFKAKAKERNM